MKKLLFILVIVLCCYTNLIAVEFTAKISPEQLQPSAAAMIFEDTPFYLYRNVISCQLDGIENKSIIKHKKNQFLLITVPDVIDLGKHYIDIYLDDSVHTRVEFTIIAANNRRDTTITVVGTDPDPKTQNGPPANCGENPQGVNRSNPVDNYPSGYYYNTGIPCDSLHVIDGQFTEDLPNNLKEWAGTIPVTGRFSNFYADYCYDNGILYIMNDWILGNVNSDTSTCYNKFEFITGNGSEHWSIIVYNALYRKIKVIRNGIDVSSDSTIVLAGAYDFGTSLLFDSAHAKWEFGIKTMGGMFTMLYTGDPVSVQIVPNIPTVTTVCNEENDYGLVNEPIRVIGFLGNQGTRLYGDKRYIPLGEVGGLVKEPHTFSGNFSKDSTKVMVSGGEAVINKCTGGHKVDGFFTNDTTVANEWGKSKPAVGKYSNLYAEYCDSTLYILNDWLLGSLEPDEQSCYNLFELYTGNAEEHWGIYVYHDINKGIKVFRNGVDVSEDTTIVLGGRFGFGKSPNSDSAHTIYEFGINCMEGEWTLMLCDPGPSTFCDGDFSSKPRQISPTIGIRKFTQNDNIKPGEHYSNLYCDKNENLNIAIGISDSSNNYFSRKFKLTIPMDSNDIQIIGVDKNDKYPMNIASATDDISYSYKNGILTILGESSQNYTAPGDFCIVRTMAKFDKNNSITITPKLELGNNTSFLRYADCKPTNISLKNSSVANNDILEAVTLIPNPSLKGNDLSLKFILNNPGNIDISIYDNNGKIVFQFADNYYQTGNYCLNIDNRSFSSGYYFIYMKLGKSTYVIPFSHLN